MKMRKLQEGNSQEFTKNNKQVLQSSYRNWDRENSDLQDYLKVSDSMYLTLEESSGACHTPFILDGREMTV